MAILALVLIVEPLGASCDVNYELKQVEAKFKGNPAMLQCLRWGGDHDSRHAAAKQIRAMSARTRDHDYCVQQSSVRALEQKCLEGVEMKKLQASVCKWRKQELAHHVERVRKYVAHLRSQRCPATAAATLEPLLPELQDVVANMDDAIKRINVHETEFGSCVQSARDLTSMMADSCKGDGLKGTPPKLGL